MLAAKLLEALARDLAQPAMLGAVLAGVVLGGSALGVLDPADRAMSAFAQFGVIAIAFQLGMRTDWRALRLQGRASGVAIAAAFVLPLAVGAGALFALGVPVVPALVAGAVVATTSAAIAARALAGAGAGKLPEGGIVSAAATASVAAGLVVVAAVIPHGGDATPGTAVLRAALALGFLAVALAVGTLAVPSLFRALDAVRGRDSALLVTIVVALLLAAGAAATGSSVATGAYVAGLVLRSAPWRKEIEDSASAISNVLAPVFLATVGASISLGALATGPALLGGAALTAAALAGRAAAGRLARRSGREGWLVGAALLPGGEAALIVLQAGHGPLLPPQFAAIAAAVLLTTALAPALVKLAMDDDLAQPDDEPSLDGADGRQRRTMIGRRRRSGR